jgi:sterol desaturase/sphingolipid hydroxylase (fatty acid hydroxylase superfamily)/CDGSH-type Zn-finger protein
MNDSLFGIKDFEVYAVLAIVAFFGICETLAGYLHRTKRRGDDWIQEVGGFFILAVVIKPLIVFAAFLLGETLIPSFQNKFTGLSIWFALPVFLLVDDFLQYWHHRFSHEYEFLWKLHRPHHQAEEMGFFVSFRNSGIFYVLFPNIWWLSLVIFLGGAKAAALGVIIKQLLVIAAHSTLTWDSFLYRYQSLNPLTTALERIFITPAFHYAHHGVSQMDGISDPNGNYGNMFSIWDQMFGTAKFTRRFPETLGLLNDPKEGWAACYFYPLIGSDNPDSELSRGFQKPRTATEEPVAVSLDKDEQFLWCRCGKSRNQPFCDGTHHGSKSKPLLCAAKRTGKARICNCKKTRTAPFCDNSHLAASKEKEPAAVVSSSIQK